MNYFYIAWLVMLAIGVIMILKSSIDVRHEHYSSNKSEKLMDKGIILIIISVISLVITLAIEIYMLNNDYI